MGTHNICFCGEIRKISAFFWLKKSSLSGGLDEPVLLGILIRALPMTRENPDQAVQVNMLILVFSVWIWHKRPFFTFLHHLSSGYK